MLRACAQDLDREEAELPARQQEPEVARRRAAATAHESELAEGDTDARPQPGEVRARFIAWRVRNLLRR